MEGVDIFVSPYGLKLKPISWKAHPPTLSGTKSCAACDDTVWGDAHTAPKDCRIIWWARRDLLGGEDLLAFHKPTKKHESLLFIKPDDGVFGRTSLCFSCQKGFSLMMTWCILGRNEVFKASLVFLFCGFTFLIGISCNIIQLNRFKHLFRALCQLKKPDFWMSILW